MVTYMAQKVTKNNTDITSKLVDELLSQVDPSEILSKDGLLSKLKKQLVERTLLHKYLILLFTYFLGDTDRFRHS